VLGYTLVPGFRALRITELLSAKLAEGGITIQDMADIQLDTYNRSADEILSVVDELPVRAIPELIESEFELFLEPPDAESIAARVEAAENAMAMLSGWECRMDPESAEAALFVEFFVELCSRVFEDEFAPEFWETGALLAQPVRCRTGYSCSLVMRRTPGGTTDGPPLIAKCAMRYSRGHLPRRTSA
jgi:penicillin amidase